MKNIILAYFKSYDFSDTQIENLLVNKAYLVLSIGLEKYESKVRKRILRHLTNHSFKHNGLFKKLGQIIQNDGLENMELAHQVYDLNLSRHPAFRRKGKSIIEQYHDRKRRVQNRKVFFDSFSHQTKSDTVLDRSKMQTLATVKKQLKNPIRFWG